MMIRIWRQVVRAALPALVVAGVIATLLLVIDTMFLIPHGAIGWTDGYGHPTLPNVGEPVYAASHIDGVAMAFVLAAGFLGAIVGFVSGWTPSNRPLLPPPESSSQGLEDSEL
jgi:hypothetical protein